MAKARDGNPKPFSAFGRVTTIAATSQTDFSPAFQALETVQPKHRVNNKARAAQKGFS
jgi:hypothetical protein